MESVTPVPSLRKLKWILRSAVALNVALVLCGAVLAVVLGYRAYGRWDLTQNSAFSISDTTQRKLGALEEPIRITVFYSKEYPPHQWAWQKIHDLLEEFRLHTDALDITYVDPHRKPAEAQQLRQKYGISENEFNDGVVVFEKGEKARYVTDTRLVERMDPMGARGPGAQAGKKLFQGEEAFISTIISLVENRKPIVYVLAGHGEAGLESMDQLGFYQARVLLERDGFEVKELRFGPGTTAVPSDADLVIVPGPQAPMGRDEAHALRAYAERFGKLLLMPTIQFRGTDHVDLNFRTVLEYFSIALGTKMIVEEPRGAVSIEAALGLIVDRYNEDHPAVRALGEGESRPTVFVSVRGVYPTGENATALAVSSPTTVEKGDISEILDQQRFENLFRHQGTIFNAEKDKRGPFPVIVASEVPGVKPGEAARAVVVGSHNFSGNIALTRFAYNQDLFMNLVNWLTARETHMGIATKPPLEVTYLVRPATRRNVFILTLVIMPLTALVAGIVIWLLRRT